MTQNIPPRPRGAQPGNANALKHGRFVEPKFSNLDPDTPLSIPSLEGEIDCLRWSILVSARLFAHIKTLDDGVHLARSITAASATLVELIKLQRWLLSDQDPATRAINKSLLEAKPRMNLIAKKPNK